MHLVYSAINNNDDSRQRNNQSETDNEMLLRYRAYQTACDKYRHEIASIQKYLPGWMPEFR
jgi:hypothetical protein